MNNDTTTHVNADNFSAEELIEMFALEPLKGEGGYFSRTYISDEVIPGDAIPRYGRDKNFGSCIFYLLKEGEYSEFHCLPSDEIYHFYYGDSVELLEIHEDGELTRTVLGRNLRAGEKIQHVVRRGTWQAAFVRPGGKVALMGCTNAPAYDQADYQKGNWEKLLRLFPKHHQLIMKFTRK
jgi:uncharacterized protein